MFYNQSIRNNIQNQDLNENESPLNKRISLFKERVPVKNEENSNFSLGSSNNGNVDCGTPSFLTHLLQTSPQIDDFEVPSHLLHFFNLIIQYRSEKCYALAASICLMILENLVETKGQDYPDVIVLLNILALLYRDQNIFETHHSAIAAATSNLAISLVHQGKYSIALPFCQASLHILKNFFGEDHPLVAKHLAHLAFIYQNEKKYEKAKQYYLRLLKLYKRKFGNNHPLIQRVLNDLTKNSFMQANFKAPGDISREFDCWDKKQNTPWIKASLSM